MILGEAVCDNCVLRFARAAKPCPGCSQTKVLAFFDTAGRAACAACTGAEAVYGCATCGREDSPYGTRCAPCVLGERAAALLAVPDGGIHPRLQPVFDALMAARRPQSVIYWLSHSTGPGVLAAMAAGELDISHAAFAHLPADKATRHVHELLAAVGVLPAFNARLEAVTPWLADLLGGLPRCQGDTINRFARWQVLRALHDRDHRGVLSASSIDKGRASIVTAARFLAWLERHDCSMATMTQTDLDRYLAAHPGRGETLVLFITWTQQAELTSGIKMPAWRRGPPDVVLSDQDRWAGVELLLHDPTIALQVRVAGLLTLLFAQPLTRICRMRADQIDTAETGTVTVRFDTLPIELPGPLDQLVADQLAHRGHASYPASAGPWLFPGGTPGKHLSTESVRAPLVTRGIHPSQARKAAMFQLAGEIPTPILADILGLGINTAARWATLAARDWSYYTALRQQNPGP